MAELGTAERLLMGVRAVQAFSPGVLHAVTLAGLSPGTVEPQTGLSLFALAMEQAGGDYPCSDVPRGDMLDVIRVLARAAAPGDWLAGRESPLTLAARITDPLMTHEVMGVMEEAGWPAHVPRAAPAALCAALEWSSGAFVRRLLQSDGGAAGFVNARSGPMNAPPLHYLAGAPSVREVDAKLEALLGAGAELGATVPGIGSALCLGALTGVHTPILAAFVRAGADAAVLGSLVDFRLPGMPPKLVTPLHAATQVSAVGRIAWLLSLTTTQGVAEGAAPRKAVDPDAVNGDGATALHVAAFFDRPEAAQALLEGGAGVGIEIETELDDKASPLLLAILAESDATARVLVDAGAHRLPHSALKEGATGPEEAAAFYRERATAHSEMLQRASKVPAEQRIKALQGAETGELVRRARKAARIAALLQAAPVS